MEKTTSAVFEQQWYVFPQVLEKQNLLDEWASVRQIRERVSKRLEEKRAAGEIGSSLAAELDIYLLPSSRLYEIFNRFQDDLRLVFITSRATLHADIEGSQKDIIKVTPSAHTKCERCWHYREDVGADAQHPTLCGRCVSNLYGSGEVRRYA